jgi:hypothetical protein
MDLRFAHIFVIAAVTFAFAASPGTAGQQLTAITDPDAYAIYAILLTEAWGDRSRENVLIASARDSGSQGFL